MNLVGCKSTLNRPVVYYADLQGSGLGVSLTLCYFVVYSTRRFVLSLALCHCVMLINLKLLPTANSFLLSKAEHETFSANKYEKQR